MGRRRTRRTGKAAAALLTLIILIVAAAAAEYAHKSGFKESYTIDGIPPYSGAASVILNDNIPAFTDEEKQTTQSFEKYSELDDLGRCGAASACLSRDTMPKEERGDISSVKPTGWQNRKYGFIDGDYIYHRCHVIGYQLSGENANERNLITGTAYMNIEGMLPYENQVAGYIRKTGNHVMYRVTPVFNGDNLLASGVIMEAYSVEDGGSVCFNVYCYNVQPNVVINYATGENRPASEQ